MKFSFMTRLGTIWLLAALPTVDSLNQRGSKRDEEEENKEIKRLLGEEYASFWSKYHFKKLDVLSTTAPSTVPSSSPPNSPSSSAPPTSAPTSYPSQIPSVSPTASVGPSPAPSSPPTDTSPPTLVPSSAPTSSASPTLEPSVQPSSNEPDVLIDVTKLSPGFHKLYEMVQGFDSMEILNEKIPFVGSSMNELVGGRGSSIDAVLDLGGRNLRGDQTLLGSLEVLLPELAPQERSLVANDDFCPLENDRKSCIKLSDVSLNIEKLRDFFEGTLGEVTKYLEKGLLPVIPLSKRLPGISDVAGKDITVLDIAQVFVGDKTGHKTVREIINVLDNISGVIDNAEDVLGFFEGDGLTLADECTFVDGLNCTGGLSVLENELTGGRRLQVDECSLGSSACDNAAPLALSDRDWMIKLALNSATTTDERFLRTEQSMVPIDITLIPGLSNTMAKSVTLAKSSDELFVLGAASLPLRKSPSLDLLSPV